MHVNSNVKNHTIPLKSTHFSSKIELTKYGRMRFMEQFVEKIVSGIGFTDILDILIVTFIIYKLIGFIR